MLKSKKVDPTTGPLLPSIIRFAIPVFLTAIIQTFMNAADMAVVGNMADSTAVASVGATGSIVALLVSSMLGISEGAKIVLARSIGAQDFERCKRIVSTAIITALTLGIFVSVAGSLLSKPFLEALDCPDDCIDGAITYLSIYFISAPLTLLYNFCAGIIATSGDSARPMKYMIISGVSNIILNVILCLMMPNKVIAVAIATVIGTGISTALAFRDVLLHDKFPFSFKKITFSPHECLLMFKYGLPLSVNSALYPIASLQIQSAVNSFGSACIAANSASAYIEGVTAAIHSGTCSATSTFVGQNIGANKPDRIKKSLLSGIGLVVCFTIPVSLVLLLLAPELIGLFVQGDAEVVAHGMIRMKYTLPLYFVPGITGAVNSTLNAYGYTFIPSASSIFSVLVFRVIWMTFIYPLNPIPDMLYICYIVSWSINFILCTSAFFIIYFTKIKRDRVKKI